MQADLQSIMNDMDVDGNDKIDFNEFCAMMERKRKSPSAGDKQQQLLQAFRVFGKFYISCGDSYSLKTRTTAAQSVWASCAVSHALVASNQGPFPQLRVFIIIYYYEFIVI